MPGRDEVDALRARWEQRSGDDRLFRINADRTDWTDEDFLASGEEDVAREVDPFLHLLDRPASSSTALDLGCGVGRLSRALATRFARVEGVDIAAPMVEAAGAFAPPVPAHVRYQVCAGDGSVPLEAAGVDFAFSFLVLQHLPSAALVQAHVLELARVLAPGGVGRVQVNGARRSLRQRLSVGVEDSDRMPLVHRKPRLRLDPHSSMGVVFDERGARRLADRAGLDLLDLQGLGQPHLWLLVRRPATP
jgi:SAM-dependent methyltransferase